MDASHRPWPAPRGRPALGMTWRHLAFLHWRVPAAPLRERLPRGVELDLRGGDAWLGVVPFLMDRTRFRWSPPLPTARRFPELNVRTYVTVDGKPGVWFFSLDAASRLAVRGARLAFSLPYFDARMRIDAGETVRYASRRTHRAAPPAELRAEYRATGAAAPAEPGSLEAFLAERYCLYAARRNGTVRRGEVLHPPWRLAPGSADLAACSMTRLAGVELEGEPLVHVADPIDVVAWWPEDVPRAPGR